MPKSLSVGVLRPSYSINSVENVFDLLDAICDEGGEICLTELSDRLGLSRPIVFRLLATLESRGLVVRGTDAHKYSLGLTAYEMGQKLLYGMTMMRKSRPVMERLARATDEAVYLAVPCNDELLMLEMVDSCQQVKVAPLIGRRLPLSATSLGKFFLKIAPLSGRKKGRSTSLAVEEKDGLKESPLACTAEDEYSFGDGVTTLGVPLFNARDQVVAVLAIIGPTFRIFSEQRHKELFQLLTDAGMAISTSLGYVSPYLRPSYADN